jgi:hypothetical protein
LYHAAVGEGVLLGLLSPEVDEVERLALNLRAVIVLAIVAGAVSPAFGQYRGGGARRATPSQVPRYAPSTPTVSPYVNLLNRNGSVASNYFGLVRPLERQQAVNQAQSQTAYTQAQQLKEVQEQQSAFEQPTVKPTGTAGWFQNMGTTSPYQVNSHYYGQWQTGKPQRRNTGR